MDYSGQELKLHLFQRQANYCGVIKVLSIFFQTLTLTIMLESECPLMVSSSITQLSTISTSRAAFLQCLRWGIWCPFKEPADWKGGEIRLALQGGAKPNPYGVMVYSTEMPAKSQSPVPLSAPGTAQVTQ